MQSFEEIINNLMAELKRGTLILSVLSQLKEEGYGYFLIHKMQNSNINVDSDTLYPLMRRLETQGLLISEMKTVQEKARKYYKRTELGNKVYEELLDQWKKINKSVEDLIKGEEK